MQERVLPVADPKVYDKEATEYGFDTDEAQEELSGVTNLRIGPGNGLAAG